MNKALREKMIAYYTKYYRDDCSLPDWQKRVEARLEEEKLDSERMKDLQALLHLSFYNQKQCIVGAGTAGLALVLKRTYHCDVYGVEPSEEEFSIIEERCREEGINPEHFKKERGEKMSFPDNEFDVVHCITVLEHVQSIEQCIHEMLRVVKPGGYIYIDTPNYAFPYEAHYKIVFPTFLPKFFGYVYLRLLGKSPQFLKTVNFITPRTIDTLLAKRDDVVWMRLYRPQRSATGRFARILNYLKFKRFIYANQEIIIQKRG